MNKYFDWFIIHILPLLPIPALFALYFVLCPFFTTHESSFNNWYGVVLQIIGGFQLVWSIDTNLRGFKGQTITQAIKKEAIKIFNSFPLRDKTNVSIIHGTASLTVPKQQLKSDGYYNNTNISQKIEFLEKRINLLEETLDNRVADFHSILIEQKKDYQSKIDELNTTSSNLKMLLTDVAVGGIRGQITGLLIVVIGTIISAIQ